MHTIHIDSLAVSCLMGRTGDEPRREQPIFIDITYRYERNLEREGTIDYDEVEQVAEAHLRGKHYIFLEDAAAGITDALWQRFPLDETTVTLRKPGALKRAQFASATVRRTK